MASACSRVICSSDCVGDLPVFSRLCGQGHRRLVVCSLLLVFAVLFVKFRQHNTPSVYTIRTRTSADEESDSNSKQHNASHFGTFCIICRIENLVTFAVSAIVKIREIGRALSFCRLPAVN